MLWGVDVGSVTVGLDIGTTSVKAVACDDEGAVLARARVPHRVVVPTADRFEHDADQAWRRGPRRALAALGDLGRVDARGIGLASMVPSMTAVDRRGRPLTPGLLYGDARGREDPGEVVGFLRWTAGQAPDARGYWPAGAVALHALGGAPAVDLGVALTSPPLFGSEGWDPAVCDSCGARTDQMPAVEMPGAAVGRLGGQDGGAALAAGSVDVWCEQMVAGAGSVGDVHVICGTTLIVWAVVGEALEAPGLWTVQHATPGQYLVGGASNAGGLFLDWVGRLIGRTRAAERLDPADVPVWTPYARGERTPYHDPDRRAGLHDLALTHGPPAVQRAAWEASAFVARHHLDLAAVTPDRIVATGGGTRIAGWMQALADATRLPVHVAASPEGAARGAAFLARVAAGLESDFGGAARWASTGHIVEPDPRWVEPMAGRYRRFLELSGPPAAGAGPGLGTG